MTKTTEQKHTSDLSALLFGFFCGCMLGYCVKEYAFEYFIRNNTKLEMTDTKSGNKQIYELYRNGAGRKDTTYFVDIGNGKFITQNKYEQNVKDSTAKAFEYQKNHVMDSLKVAKTNTQKSIDSILNYKK